jgi:cysteine desulfurase
LVIDNKRQIYVDNSAGRPVDSRVIDIMLPYFKKSYGNPSSLHRFGQEAKEAIDNSREKIAKLINAEKSETIIFTSGATESNNLAIKGMAIRNRKKGTKILTSAVEHMSVVNSCKSLMRQGFQTTFSPVDLHGLLDIEKLEKNIDDQTKLVSIVYANGEVGSIQPINKISQIVHKKGAYLHVDATAVCGQIPVDVQKDGIDMMTISSNDMYGPKGIGALYLKDSLRIDPLIHGGGQERGLRSGTENVSSIVGFGSAAELARSGMKSESKRLVKIRDNLIRGLIDPIPYAFLNGHPTKRLPDNVSVRFNFIEGESILLSLAMSGVFASSGSACTAKTLQPSHALLAMGLKHEEAHGSLMITLGRQTTQNDADYIKELIPSIIERLRDMSPLTPKELKK